MFLKKTIYVQINARLRDALFVKQSWQKQKGSFLLRDPVITVLHLVDIVCSPNCCLPERQAFTGKLAGICQLSSVRDQNILLVASDMGSSC